MEEMHRAKYRERAWCFHALSRCSALPKLHVCTSPEAL